jgi:subtilase family serine protease
MKLRFLIACLTSTLTFALVVASVPTSAQEPAHSLPTRHVRDAVRTGQAAFLNQLAAAQEMRLAIVLPLRNSAELEQLLDKLNDSRSPLYRHYLSVPEFTERFAPTQEDYDAVVGFAKANGMTVTNVSPNRLVVDVGATVASVEKAFHVTMGVYMHPTESRTFYSPDREPSVDLNVALWHISGLDNFSLARPLYRKAATGSGRGGNSTGSGPDGSFLGSDRRAAYYGGTTLTGTGQAVGLFEGDGYALSDVQAYFKNVGQALKVPIDNVLLDGASAGSDGDDTEQVIDIIDAISMAPALAQVIVYIAPESSLGSGGDTDIFNAMASENLAAQLSCSWNWEPADPGSDDPIFMEFAAQGQNLFVASGDEGAYNSSQPFHYPEEDANVVAVGGTVLTTNGAGGSWNSEIAWGGSNTSCAAGTGSGGGPSPDHIPIPSYQKIAGVINSSNKGSTTLRNDPDVAAEANCDNYYCANGSCGTGLGGTSLAAPTWAGYVALAKQQVASTCGSPFGSLNPLIYPIGVGSGHGAAFHDITVGDNFNSESPSLYSAVAGYDLVTGWGSPNGAGLITALTTSAPGFSLLVSPSSQTINPGQEGSFQMTVTVSGGFSGSVSLSDNCSQWGFTCYLEPSTVTAKDAQPCGSSTMNLVVPSVGDYPESVEVTITATSGSVSHHVLVSVTVP